MALPNRGLRDARLAAVALAAALGILLWFALRGGRRAPSEEALLAGAKAGAGPREGSKTAKPTSRAAGDDHAARTRPAALAPPTESADAEEPESKEVREKRLERAQRTLDTYLASTKYPPGSRPLSEQPDQVKPHNPHTVKLPLARGDQKLTDARVALHQDRFFVAADEAVTFFMECETSEGPSPCEVLSSIARPRAPSPQNAAAAPSPASAPSATVTFLSAATGGALSAVFAPGEQGFQGYYGPIHLDIELRVAGEEGRAGFDIVYSPSVPATFTGAVREVIEDGSLSLYIGMDAVKAGRYVLAARVEDASGRPFALLSFNEMLAAGRVEAKLVLFGKLILDEGASAPFRLRDLEGFLLKEDTYPDREIVPSIDGPIFTTKAYPKSDFSDKEWQSEERDRHQNEFRKDVEQARKALEAGGD